MTLTVVQTWARSRVTTRYLVRASDGALFWGSTARTPSEIRSMPPGRLPCSSYLNPNAFFPVYNSKMTRYAGSESDPSVYIKLPRIISFTNFYCDANVQREIRSLIKREIRSCELLLRNPHANICTYMGVVTDAKDRVIGLAYKRYATDLFTLVENTPSLHGLPASEPLSKESIIQAITNGMHHMHGLGLVHCDIRPENIFVDPAKGEVVIGDFDGTHTEGEALEGRVAPPNWWPGSCDVCTAQYLVDYQLVERIGLWFDLMAENAKTVA